MKIIFTETDIEGEYRAKLKTVFGGFKIERECEVVSIEEKDKQQMKQYALSDLIEHFYEQIMEVEKDMQRNEYRKAIGDFSYPKCPNYGNEK